MIIITSPPETLHGELIVPGDRSITHRAVVLGALSRGVTEVRGFLKAKDTLATINCLRLLGARITARGERLLINGQDMKFKHPVKELDVGESDITAWLIAGILSGQHFNATITGDQCLKKLHPAGIAEPLRLMGASIYSEGEQLPLKIRGGDLKPIKFKTPPAGSRLKSAVLLAGLYAEGLTEVVEPFQGHNHMELMLTGFGAKVQIDGCRVSVRGRSALKGRQVRVPGDISVAAFFMVAAAIVPGSEVLLKNVGVNHTRSGIIDALTLMGADLTVKNNRFWGKEPVADILIRGSAALKGVSLEGAITPRLINEIPALAVAAAKAEGRTSIGNINGLAVNELTYLSKLSEQLGRLGVKIKETGDGIVIEGGTKLKGAEVESCADHRIAMALAVAGLDAGGETGVHDAEVIGTSFPGFIPALRSLLKKQRFN